MNISIRFRVKFYLSSGHFCRNFGIIENFSKCPYIREVFWGDLSNSFDYDEKGVKVVFEVTEHESVLKIQVAPF